MLFLFIIILVSLCWAITQIAAEATRQARAEKYLAKQREERAKQRAKQEERDKLLKELGIK